MIPAIYRIDRRAEEFPGTFTLDISKVTAGAVPGFTPGAFNMLYVFGTGEVPISMSGAESECDGYRHTIRTHGLTTEALSRLKEGDQLGVRGPFGRGWPLKKIEGKDLLIVAGGLGLAPLRPVIQEYLSHKLPVRSIQLYYGARAPGERLYPDELAQWSQSMKVVQSVDRGDPDWKGHVGVVTAPLETAQIDTDETLALICGPEIMMRFCIHTLLARGLPPESIYLSMERNMKCATGHCGHCQWGPNFVCKDGPVFCYGEIQRWFQIRAL